MPISRRSLLGTLGAAAAAPLTSSAATEGNMPGDLKIGVASYSLRGFNRKLAIAMLKKLDAKYVSIKDFHLAMNLSREDVAKQAAEFTKAGITILGGGTIYFRSKDDKDIRQKFEYAKAAGMPLITAGPERDILPLLEKYVKEYDIKIAVHNHGPEDKHFPSPESALEILKNMDPRMGVCIDIGHTTRTGTDPVEAVKKAGPRLLDMHVKDLADLMNKDSQVAVGEGKMPIVPLFKQLLKMNYQGGVMLEYEINEEDPLPGMYKSLAYMRGVVAGLKA
jgi:sugar phosphate isomerase/epimerase